MDFKGDKNGNLKFIYLHKAKISKTFECLRVFLCDLYKYYIRSMDLKNIKHFRVKMEELFQVINEESYGKIQSQTQPKRNYNEMTVESLTKLTQASLDWIEAYQDLNDQINQKKELLLKSKKAKE